MFRSVINKHRNGDRGFAVEAGMTLIELLIVVVILGVLSAIVVFAVGGFTNTGKTESCKTDLATLNTANEAYFAKNNSYAADAATLQGAGFIKNLPGTADG